MFSAVYCTVVYEYSTCVSYDLLAAQTCLSRGAGPAAPGRRGGAERLRPPARLGPHSVAPLLHRPRACPQARPQAQKGWSIKAHSQDVHNTHVLKIFSAATISDRHMCQTYIV